MTLCLHYKILYIQKAHYVNSSSIHCESVNKINVHLNGKYERQ